MAGIKGMANPEQVKPVSPELNIQAPEGMRFSSPQDQYVDGSDVDIDSLVAEFEGGVQAQSINQQPAQDIDIDSLMSEFEQQTEPMGFLGEAAARAKSSFAITQKELKQSLEDSYGKQNVRQVGEDLQYRNGTKGDWQTWDAGFEPVGDVLDFTRSVVEEVPASAATALAAIPAVATAIGTGGAGVPLAAGQIAAARSAGGVVGQALGDAVQALVGIERDPERSAAVEYSLTAALSPIAGAIGDFATKKLAQRTSQQAKLLAPKDLFKSEVVNISESVDFLKNQGMLQNIPGTDTPLILSQLNPSNASAQMVAQKASKLPQFRQALEEQAQGIENGLQGFIRGLGNVLGETPETGTKFKNLVVENIKREGKLIGDARKLLVDQAGNAELPVPKLKKAVENYASELGFKVGGQNDLKAMKDFLVEEQGFSKQAADLITNKTSKMLERVTNKEGRMTAEELMGAYVELNGAYRNVVERGMDADPLFRRKLGELRRFIADEITEKVGVIADPVAKSKYVNSLAEYKQLVEAADEFKSLFKNEKIASHSLSKAIFDKGKGGLDNLEAAKVLLKDSPELFDEVKGNYLKEIRAKHFNSATGKTNWNGFLKDVNSLGPEMIDSAFGSNAKEGLKHWTTVMKAVEEGLPNLENPKEKAKLVKDLVLSAKSKVAAANTAVSEILDLDTQKYLAQAISRDGIESFLATVPKDQKSLVRSILEGVQKGAQASAIALPAATRETIREKRETKQ
jgi:hypothetical protein